MKHKVLFWISILMQLLQIAAAALAVKFIMQLDMIPEKFTNIIIVAFGVLILITALIMFVRGRKPVSVVRTVIAWVLVIASVVGCWFLSNVVGEFQSTVTNITTTIISEETRDVYVRKDDPAKSIMDASNYLFAVVEGYDEENTQLALDAVSREFADDVNTKSYPTVFAMIDGLYANEVDALIMNSGYITILEEYPDYQDFEDKTKLLYEAVLEVPMPITTEPELTIPDDTEPIETTEVSEDFDPTTTPFVLYFSGSDTRNTKLNTRSRSDVNILAVINPVSHQVLLVNTPRDYYIPNPRGGGALDKLTHCGIYGIECSMKALSNLYSTDVDFYAQINFTGFETLVDAVGGVTVYSDQSFTSVGGHYFPKGENFLNGKSALAFARERYNVKGGDNGRGKNQMKVITALIGKMTDGPTLISRYSEILASLDGMFRTNFPMEEVSKLVKMQLADMPSWEVYSFAVTGRNGQDITYSMPGAKTSVMYQNSKLVGQASELIEKVLAGEVITDADLATS